MQSARELLEELNDLDEHQHLEAKSGAGKSLLETICAFSNEPGLGGGTILIGVSKDETNDFPRYAFQSIHDPDLVASQIASECASVFNIPVRPTIQTEAVDGKKVLIVEINEAAASEKPIYIKKSGLPKGAFRRIGATDQSCTEDDLAALFGKRDLQTYDETPLQGATLGDLDPEAIEFYRKLRSRVNPEAEELRWADDELLESLSATTKFKGQIIPTMAGILLFGHRKALRRLLPMVRVDYIRIQGKEWVENPDERFSTTDMRGSLLQLGQRIQDQIFEDLPKAFSLEEGHVQAESQTLPAKVLREAIVNALMHASYRVHQPIQILRYSNRIEIRNPGYSLKNEDQLGEPGSRPRNPKIAAIFHETNLAETKGSGIRTMRKLMEENGFAPPTFESDRDNNQFTTRLLLHHFLTALDLEWIKNLGIDTLNDAQKKALLFVRESGAINNQTYRQLCAVETLVASNELRQLCDLHLLEKKGKSRATYYVTGTAIPQSETILTMERNRHQLDPNRHQLPENLKQAIQSLGPKPRIKATQEIVLKLCQSASWRAEDLMSLLGKSDKKRLVRSILNPMIAAKQIEYTIPESPRHPYQEYRAVMGQRRGDR